MSPGMPYEGKINTAVLLAAGTGNRLRPLTENKPKCLVEVDGRSLLCRIIKNIEAAGFKRLVIVTGYEAGQIESFVSSCTTSLEIELVHNEKFDTTNNIYSLWKVFPYVNEGFALLEADLIFEVKALEKFMSPNRIALDRFIPGIHCGTTAEVNNSGYLSRLFVSESPSENLNEIWKTVNITSFCPKTREALRLEVEKQINTGNVNIFYEYCIRDLVSSESANFEMVNFSEYWWDEIDTLSDLGRVESYLAARSENVEVYK